MIINQTAIKKYSIFPQNYDLTEVMTYVDTTELIWVVPTIGQEWYDELNEQVETNTLTEINGTALVEAIWPYLGCALSYESLPLVWSTISEVGLTLGKSDNSDSIGLKDLNYVQNHIRRQLEVRKDFLIKYLCERQSSFPLFDPSICNCGCNTNSCCGGNVKGKLNKPNPYQQLYRPIPKCTDIK